MERIEEAAMDYGAAPKVRFDTAIPEPIFLLRRDGSVTGSSRAGRALARTPEALSELLHPEDRGLFRQAVASFSSESEVEVRIATDAGYRLCRWSLFEAGDDRVLAMADTDDRFALRENARLADAVFYGSNASLLVLDRQGRIVRFNPVAERLSGMPADEVLGKPIWEVLVAPEQRDEIRHCIGSPPTPGVWQREIVWQTRGLGRRKLSCTMVTVQDFEGTADYFVISGIDVTECCTAQRQLAEAEERYRRLVELAYVLEVTECEGQIVSMNERGAQFLGAESPDSFIGRPFTSLFVPEEHDSVAERFSSAAQGWKPAPPVERTLVRLDGSRVVVEAAAIPITFRGRSATHAVFRDISGRKANERELERYRERLEELVTQRTTELLALNRELETFSHSVSHDLRAPLRAINGFVGALLEDFSDRFEGEAGRYLNRIAANTERMADIIDNLLTLSRVARHQMNRESVDLADIARQVVEGLRVAEPERDVEVRIGNDLITTGDPALLRVVLQNLIGNAWKYSSRESEPRIEFSSYLDDQGRRTFVVRDNGVGFDMSHADDLFGAFNRLHSPAEFEGSGIGLATVKRIVHRHGGEVWAEGREGEGASFFFRLPQ